jgi:hypothetical protein
LYELQYTPFMVNGPGSAQTVFMNTVTPTDATLLVQLAEWQTRQDLAGALSWFWSDDFRPDSPLDLDGDEDRKAALICSYFETVGTLHTHGLVNEELLFDWLEVAPAWDRIKDYVLRRRKAAGGKPMWTHFEALATAHKRRTREYST